MAPEGAPGARIEKEHPGPGNVKFQAVGKNGDFGVNLANLPLTARFILDPLSAGLSGQCAETAFPPLPALACVANTAQSVVLCR